MAEGISRADQLADALTVHSAIDIVIPDVIGPNDPRLKQFTRDLTLNPFRSFLDSLTSKITTLGARARSSDDRDVFIDIEDFPNGIREEIYIFLKKASDTASSHTPYPFYSLLKLTSSRFKIATREREVLQDQTGVIDWLLNRKKLLPVKVQEEYETTEDDNELTAVEIYKNFDFQVNDSYKGIERDFRKWAQENKNFRLNFSDQSWEIKYSGKAQIESFNFKNSRAKSFAFEASYGDLRGATRQDISISLTSGRVVITTTGEALVATGNAKVVTPNHKITSVYEIESEGTLECTNQNYPNLNFNKLVGRIMADLPLDITFLEPAASQVDGDTN